MKEKIIFWIESGMPHAEGYTLFLQQARRRASLDRTLSKNTIDNRKSILWHLCNLNNMVDWYEKYTNTVGKEPAQPPRQMQIPNPTNDTPGNNIDDETEKAQALIASALNDEHAYLIPFELLPEKLQKMVIEKGKLYNQFDMLKKRLNADRSNSPQTIEHRKQILKDMKDKNGAIRFIHNELREYEKTGKQAEMVTPAEKVVSIDSLILERKNRINNRSKLKNAASSERPNIRERGIKNLEKNEARIAEIDALIEKMQTENAV
jgi:hypothetical protein